MLGALFSSRDYQQNQTELVVIVTPYIAEPVHQKQLATPADRFNDRRPTCSRFFSAGSTGSMACRETAPPASTTVKVGHIID